MSKSLKNHFVFNSFNIVLQSLRNRKFWKEFDMRARMRPAWCYLIRLRETDTFDMRARAARVASWDRNVEHVFGVL